MKIYNVGYFTPTNTFVIFAQTQSEFVSDFIKTSYNEAYKKNKMSDRCIVLENADVPDDYRFAKD
jgi:hypothetical protein